MPTMGEIITANPKFRKEAERLGAKLDEYAEARIDSGTSAAALYSFPQTNHHIPTGFTRERTIELNDQTLAFVHRMIWNVSRKVHLQDHDYRLFDKRNVLPEILIASFGMDKQAAVYTAKQFTKQLAYTGRARYIGQPRRGHVRFWIIDPDSMMFKSVDGWTSTWKPSARARAEIEQQAKKAEELAGDVTVTVDLRTIEPPSPEKMNADSLREYFLKLTASADKLSEVNKTLERRLAAAIEQVDELSAKIVELENEKEADELGKVVDAINEWRGGTG